jgi:predicted CoA-substrate-specific enzyme activase
MKSVGFCLGASNISMVILEKIGNQINIVKKESISHEGNVKVLLKKLINENKIDKIDKIVITGRKFKKLVNLTTISEPLAIENAYSHLIDKYNSLRIIVSAGGETFMVYELDKKGKIINVYTGNKCASGTGEFFLQQLKRMNLNIEDAMDIADIENIHKVAGRCSVFCKSDCTHALNKGKSKGSVVAGLCQMMSSKIIELLKQLKSDKILLIGGTSQNRIMIDFLKKEKPNIIIANESEIFESLGAAIWALNNKTKKINLKLLFKKNQSNFTFLPSLKDYLHKVTFKSMNKGIAKKDDRCIIGLDVGSTTTKAILLREKDNQILASIYLRTNGDPIKASRECYKNLKKQLKVNVKIIGLGVTGSGRQIAGLHALTDGIINEIIAHATAAIYFDSEVDTIFEIGGQDAKYTFITNKVPSDYAMNEACSAGTGSFLEESAKESMGIETEKIADIALNGKNPPNFNDQCSAFISSDIKNAIQDGIKKEDIVAGLVYSVCQNYVNRVKGNRAVGKKIFMQGGVCYNKAVPIAMAVLTGNEIIVPPKPGLMGCYGVALEIKNKIKLGLIAEKEFDLNELSKREVIYEKNFICAGGKEKCDRKCTINLIKINGKKYPFGGACNKYVNLIKNIEFNSEKFDLVTLREKLVFKKYAPLENNNLKGKKIGIIKSLMVNSLYPLYYNFFTKLGLNVVLSDKIDNEGIEKKTASFCFPIEISHGYFSNLLSKKLDYIFLPQIKGMFVGKNNSKTVTCPLVQGEPYFLKTTFDIFNVKKILTPVLNFSKGYDLVVTEFLNIGRELGFSKKKSLYAYRYAVKKQKQMFEEMKKIGKNVLLELEKDNDKIGIVLFGRPYNAFSSDTNMGISHKFASRGYLIIPIDFLPYENEKIFDTNMYWSMGQIILKSSKFVKNNNQLFATFITNFSCGPDSFLIGYFRNIMGTKPSLTLELDSHTADAGIDTRIEAFLDIIKSYIELKNNKVINQKKIKFNPASIEYINKKLLVKDSYDKRYKLTDKKVHVLIPSMGHISSKALVSTLRYTGINANVLDAPNEEELKIGRMYSSCKECLPLTLTLGSLFKYLKNRKNSNELVVFFMPTASGPCRFGQYNALINNLIVKEKLNNVAILSLHASNGYGGLGFKFIIRAWQSIVISDVLEEIYSSILVLSENKEYALKVFNKVSDNIINGLKKYSWKDMKILLKKSVDILSKIPLKNNIHFVPKILLSGEIYVRRDAFSRQYLIEKLANEGIIVKVAPIAEWIYYLDYRIQSGLEEKSNFFLKLKNLIQGFVKRNYEKDIKKIFSLSGLYEYNIVNVEKYINNIKDVVSPKLEGEAILTVGGSITEIIDDVSGIIIIGPFGCMPNRISESIINKTLNYKKIDSSDNIELTKNVLNEFSSLPFLAIETDGGLFPQIVQARLEAFCLQVKRLNNHLNDIKKI